jgi:hypothetical protein
MAEECRLADVSKLPRLLSCSLFTWADRFGKKDAVWSIPKENIHHRKMRSKWRKESFCKKQVPRPLENLSSDPKEAAEW